MMQDVPKASKDSIIFSISFIIKNGVDGTVCGMQAIADPERWHAEFELGELSGCLRNIISTVGKSYQCSHKGMNILHRVDMH